MDVADDLQQCRVVERTLGRPITGGGPVLVGGGGHPGERARRCHREPCGLLGVDTAVAAHRVDWTYPPGPDTGVVEEDLPGGR
jgi:hypothetical protein